MRRLLLPGVLRHNATNSIGDARKVGHSDGVDSTGRRNTAICYAERLTDVGDSYGNALAESVVGLYNTECMKIDGPFRTVDELELATHSWVHWFNENRLHSSIGYPTPIEQENKYYREMSPQSQSVLGQFALR